MNQDLTIQTGNQSVVEGSSIFFGDMKQLLARQLSPSSIAMYRRDVAAYQTHATETGQESLDEQTLARWRDSLAFTSSMSPNTINRKIAA